VTNRRVNARGTAVGESHGTAGPCGRRHQLRSAVKPNSQPKSLLATRSESLPITSRAGNDRNASPGELDFMHGWMTSRHEGCVSTMLTDKRLEYCTAVGATSRVWRREMDDASRQARHFGCFPS